jgi:hypothetical protein
LIIDYTCDLWWHCTRAAADNDESEQQPTTRLIC